MEPRSSWDIYFNVLLKYLAGSQFEVAGDYFYETLHGSLCETEDSRNRLILKGRQR